MIFFQSHIDALLKAKDDQIAVIREELERLRHQADYERKRADIAVDRLLSQENVGPISPDQTKRVAQRAEEILQSVHASVMVGRDFEEKDAKNAES